MCTVMYIHGSLKNSTALPHDAVDRTYMVHRPRAMHRVRVTKALLQHVQLIILCTLWCNSSGDLSVWCVVTQVDADFLAMIKEAEDDDNKGAEGATLDVDPSDDI